MIDFRYHLVSLMAVLVALTLGVILGAGPLQGRISDTLSGEVDRLAQRQTELQSDHDALNLQIDQYEQFVDSLNQQLSTGLLDQAKIAVLSIEGTDEDREEELLANLQGAGGEILTQITVHESWFLSQESTEKTTLAAKFKEQIGTEAAEELDSVKILSIGLAKAIQGATQLQGDFLTELADSSDKLITVEKTAEQAADLLVVLGPQSSKDSAEQDAEKQETVECLDAVSAFAQIYGSSLVVVGDSLDKTDLVYQLRDSKVTFTTVDSIGTSRASLNLVLGLANARQGKTYQLGSQEKAELPVAPLPEAVSDQVVPSEEASS